MLEIRQLSDPFTTGRPFTGSRKRKRLTFLSDHQHELHQSDIPLCCFASSHEAVFPLLHPPWGRSLGLLTDALDGSTPGPARFEHATCNTAGGAGMDRWGPRTPKLQTPPVVRGGQRWGSVWVWTVSISQHATPQNDMEWDVLATAPIAASRGRHPRGQKGVNPN